MLRVVAMQESVLYENFPYCSRDYDSRFINREVILHIRNFCKSNPYIEEFFAKGSIIHGCMIVGSDIDHVRIRVNKELEIDEKIELVDSLEYEVQGYGVSELKRVREDEYVRVFSDWNDLKDIPHACNRQCELYPNLNIVTAKSPEDWFKKVIRVGHSYAGNSPSDWAKEMRKRILI